MSFFRHIDTLRAKPEHVRQRIALGAASGITAVVALGWAGTLLATGAFTLAPSGTDAPASFAQVTPTAGAAANTPSNFNELMGAVGAGLGTTQKPELLIEDNGASSTLDRTAPQASATVLTF